MKTWEKLIYAICVITGATLLTLWVFAVFVMDITGGALITFQALLMGLASLLFLVPFLSAPLPGAVPLYKKWYGWVIVALILITLYVGNKGY